MFIYVNGKPRNVEHISVAMAVLGEAMRLDYPMYKVTIDGKTIKPSELGDVKAVGGMDIDISEVKGA